MSEKTQGVVNLGALLMPQIEGAIAAGSEKYAKMPILKNMEIGTDQATRTASYNTKALREAQNVFGHSGANLDYFKIDGKRLNAKEFYNTMLDNGYKTGTDIYMYCCGTGSNGLAQEVSNLSGANVKAPTGEINPTWGGNLAKNKTGVPGSKVVDIKPTNTRKTK